MESSPTRSRTRSIQPDLSLHNNPEITGISDLISYGQPKNYFQPISDHNPRISQTDPVSAGSPSVDAAQHEASPEPLVSCFEEEYVHVPDVTPPFVSPQTPSSVASFLLPRCDTLSVTQSKLFLTSCSSNTGNPSKPPDLGTISSSPTLTSSAALHTKVAPQTSSPQLLLPTLDAVSSPHKNEASQIQLGQTTESASSALCSDLMSEDVEVSSWVSQQQGTVSKLPCGFSLKNADQASNIECIQQDEDELGKGSKENKMNCISDEGLPTGANFLEPDSNSSHLHSPLNVSINPNDPVEMMSEENIKAQVSLKDTTALPASISDEAFLEMPSVPEEPTPHSDISIKEAESNQSELSYLSPHVPINTSESKSGQLVDYMSVSYLQITKAAQEETQRPSEPNQSFVSSTLIPNVDKMSSLAPLVVEDLKNDAVQNQLGHKHNGQEIIPVVADSIPDKDLVCKNICQPQPHGPVKPGLQTPPTNWTPQSESGANYTNYYGCVYPDYQKTGPRVADQHSVYYPWASLDFKGYCPQTRAESQFYGQNQNNRCEVKQPEQPSAEHISARPQRSKDRSARTDQDKTHFYSTQYSEGWDSQGYCSPAYYQGFYYPYDYEYKSEVFRNYRQPYTKLDTYEDWWRYDPRYDSTFDRSHFAQYEQSYGDQCDRQSCHSDYSTQSMPSTHSYDSHVSWNPDQIWGHQHLQHVGCLDYGTSAESHRDGHDALENEPRNQDFNSACSSKSETSSDKQGPAPMEKFSSPHCCARFGPGGLFIQVLPNLPSEGKPALVNIHSTEVMLHGLWDQVDLKTFPGPFTKDKTDKAEVLRLIKNKCHKCVQNDTSTDEGTSSLIWDLMRLICRQNGKLVGTDVSHLLLSNQRSHCSLKEATSDLIDFTHEPFSRAQEIHMGIAESTTEDTQRDLQHFRELLIIGKKKDALKTAVSKGLWEHAFMLASKMDSVAYSQVMSKFIDSLPESDALRTFYQLMSGRIPVSASNCRFKEHEDWRIHLAMVLSNHTCFKHLHKKTITKMADTLASNGCCTAASFCYMVSQLDVDTQSYKSDVFLFGVSPNVPHLKYATNEAIQRTELFEYSLCLGTNSVHLPNFQIFKFIYACRLAEAGLCTQALQYCEVIANTLLTSGAGSYLTLVNQLLELSAKIRLFDQQLKDISEPELQHEPEWIVNLKILRSQMIEQLNSTSREEQTESTDVVPRGSPGEPAVLTTEMPKHEGSPPQVQLALPASQDEIRTKVAPVESWQVLDSDPPEPDNKALPVPTVTSTGCLVSHKPSPRANANSLAEGVPTLAKESNATSELQLLTVPSSAALPDKLAHTEDCWSEDRPKLTTETVGSLLLPLLAPSTFQQGRPVNAVPTTQSQYTENHHNLSVNTDSVSAEFTLRPSSLSSATLPSLVTEPGTVPQITAPLPYTPSFAQTGQPCQSQYPIPPLSLSVAPPPMSSGSVNWVTEQYLRDLPPVLPASPPLLYEPLAWQPLTPAVSDDRFQAVYTMESQTAPHPTTPLPAAHISPPDTSAPSAEPSQREAWTQFTPLVTAPLPADHMLSQKTPPLFGKKPHVMAEGTAHPGQMPAAPKPFTPKLFVPQSPVPDPQPEKDAGGGWFRWLFGKKSEVPLVTDTDKADVPNTKR